MTNALAVGRALSRAFKGGNGTQFLFKTLRMRQRTGEIGKFRSRGLSVRVSPLIRLSDQTFPK